MVPERLTVCAPKQLLSPPTPEVTTRQLPKDEQKWVIEPNDGFCLRPNQVAPNVIVACDDPFFRFGGFFHPSAEHLQRGSLPVWFPIESIQFDVIQAEAFGEFICKCGLTGTGHTDDNHAFVGKRGHGSSRS